MIIMIKILGIDDFSEIYNKRLVNDFPESEVKSLKKIIDMYKKDMYFVYGYYNENGELAGYAFFINDRTKDTVLLDYFAIVPEKRSRADRKIRRSEVSSIRKYSGDPDFRKRRAGDPDISGYIKGNVPAWKYFL